MTDVDKLFWKQLRLFSYIVFIVQSVHCPEWNSCLWFKQFSTSFDVFCWAAVSNIPQEQNFFGNFTVWKWILLSACSLGIDNIPLCAMHQNIAFGGFIGYWESVLDFMFCFLKIFKLNAVVLQLISSAVLERTGKGSGLCFVTEPGSDSRWFGCISWLLFCLQLKLVQPPLFNSVDFWNSMLSIVLDIELPNKKGPKSWDFLSTRVSPEMEIPKNRKPQNKCFCVPKTCKESCKTLEIWFLWNALFLPNDLKVEVFAKAPNNKGFWTLYLEKCWKTWINMVVSNFAI